MPVTTTTTTTITKLQSSDSIENFNVISLNNSQSVGNQSNTIKQITKTKLIPTPAAAAATGSTLILDKRYNINMLTNSIKRNNNVLPSSQHHQRNNKSTTISLIPKLEPTESHLKQQHKQKLSNLDENSNDGNNMVVDDSLTSLAWLQNLNIMKTVTSGASSSQMTNNENEKQLPPLLNELDNNRLKTCFTLKTEDFKKANVLTLANKQSLLDYRRQQSYNSQTSENTIINSPTNSATHSSSGCSSASSASSSPPHQQQQQQQQNATTYYNHYNYPSPANSCTSPRRHSFSNPCTTSNITIAQRLPITVAHVITPNTTQNGNKKQLQSKLASPQHQKQNNGQMRPLRTQSTSQQQQQQQQQQTLTSKLPDNNQNDYRLDPTSKPPFSYSQLIIMAMKESKCPKMTLQMIYDWIIDNFIYFKKADPSWQVTFKNSIRHNLSLNKCFKKIARQKDEPGKGGFWMLDPEFEKQYENNSNNFNNSGGSTSSLNVQSNNNKNQNSNNKRRRNQRQQQVNKQQQANDTQKNSNKSPLSEQQQEIDKIKKELIESQQNTILVPEPILVEAANPTVNASTNSSSTSSSINRSDSSLPPKKFKSTTSMYNPFINHHHHHQHSHPSQLTLNSYSYCPINTGFNIKNNKQLAANVNNNATNRKFLMHPVDLDSSGEGHFVLRSDTNMSQLNCTATTSSSSPTQSIINHHNHQQQHSQSNNALFNDIVDSCNYNQLIDTDNDADLSAYDLCSQPHHTTTQSHHYHARQFQQHQLQQQNKCNTNKPFNQMTQPSNFVPSSSSSPSIASSPASIDSNQQKPSTMIHQVCTHNKNHGRNNFYQNSYNNSNYHGNCENCSCYLLHQHNMGIEPDGLVNTILFTTKGDCYLNGNIDCGDDQNDVNNSHHHNYIDHQPHHNNYLDSIINTSYNQSNSGNQQPHMHNYVNNSNLNEDTFINGFENELIKTVEENPLFNFEALDCNFDIDSIDDASSENAHQTNCPTTVDLNTNGLIDEFIRVDDLFQYPNVETSDDNNNNNKNSTQEQAQNKMSQSQANNFLNTYNESTVCSNNSNSLLGEGVDDLVELYEFTNDITLDDTKRKSPVDLVTNIKLDLTIEGHGIKPPKWWHNFDLLDSPSDSDNSFYLNNTTTPTASNNTVQEPVVTSTSGKSSSIQKLNGTINNNNNKQHQTASNFTENKKISPRTLQAKPISTTSMTGNANNKNFINKQQQNNNNQQKAKLKSTSPIIF